MTIHLGGVCIKWLGYGFVEDDMCSPSGPAYRTRIGPAMVIQDLIAIFLWLSSGPHDQLLLGPHTAMNYGPSVDQVWIP